MTQEPRDSGATENRPPTVADPQTVNGQTDRRAGPLLRSRGLLILGLVGLGLAGYFFYVHRRGARPPAKKAVVIPESLEVVDTYAEIHMAIATLPSGTRVSVLDHTHNWSEIRLADGRTGWVDSKDLLEGETYDRAEALLKEVENSPAQGAGHTNGVVNLRLEPSRDSTQLAQLSANQRVEVFGRRVLDRPTASEQPAAPPKAPTRPRAAATPSAPREAWYLIRTASRPAPQSSAPATGSSGASALGTAARAGWVLGRFVELDIPSGLSMYAQGVNMVAWLVLDTVEDEGQQVPQYLVADRVGTQELDFNHIRVFTWWAKTHQYVTAYVEGRLNGYFPMRVMRCDGNPCFRLRLVDKAGRKYQKVYGLFGTITRPLGEVDGWESDAMPTRPVFRRAGRVLRARHRRQ